MWMMIAIPAGQGGVAGVLEKKVQRRGFNVTVAIYHVCFGLMTGVSLLGKRIVI
jgi:hypothetical protein